jgi:hypothetical protein
VHVSETSAKCQRVVICCTAHPTEETMERFEDTYTGLSPNVVAHTSAEGMTFAQYRRSRTAKPSLRQRAAAWVRAAAVGGAADVRHARRAGALAGAVAVAVVLALPAGALAQASFSAPTKLSTGGTSPVSVAVGNFNGDRDPDLATANMDSDNVSVLLGGSCGSFAAPATYATFGDMASSVAVGDFDGDSDSDLAVANYGSDNVSVLRRRDPEFFSAQNFISTDGSSPESASPNAVAVGDFDGDSDPDLAVANTLSGDVSVLLGLSGLGFSKPPDPLPGRYETGRPGTTPLPMALAAGDFNGDGDLDLAVANRNDWNVMVLLGNGDGSFDQAGGSPVPVGGAPQSIAVGDFDGDSIPDLATGNAYADVSVLLGKGDGGFSQAEGSPFATGAGPTSLAVHDFDGDSDADLAAVSPFSNDLLVLPGNGQGGFGAPSGFRAVPDDGVSAQPESLAVGDFDDDSDPDVAVTLSSGHVSALLNKRFSAPCDTNEDIYQTSEDTPLRVDAPGVLVDDVDPEGDDLSAVLESGPRHGSVTLNRDGSFVYTPNRNFDEFDTFTYRASDGTAESEPVTVFILIKPFPDAPVATDDAYATDEDAPLTIAAAGVLGNDSDADGDGLTAALVSDPANGDLTFNSDGTFGYTPHHNFSGTDSFSYRASDGAAADTATVTINVRPVNDAPAAAPDSYVTDEDTPLEVASGAGVLSNDSDVDGDDLSAVVVVGPAHGSLELGGQGSLSYTPARDFNGTDSFSYRTSDGELVSETVTVTIDVGPVNDAPAAEGDTYATDEDTALEVAAAAGVLSNDSDVEGDALSAAVASGPAHGSLSLTAEGSLSYTPKRDYNGSDSFEYSAGDGADSGTATVTIDVRPVNDAPAATGDAYQTDEDTPLHIDAPGVLANDTDIDADALAAGLVSGAVHGSLDLRGDGSLRYTPDPDYNGSDSFSYRAFDGGLDSDTVTVTIEVRPVDEPPPAGPAQPPAGAGPAQAPLANPAPPPPASAAQPFADFTIGSVRFKSGSTMVSVVVPGPGTVTAQQVSASTARISAAAKRKTLVKRLRKVATKAGPVRLTLKPTKAGMKLLRHKKKLTARIRFTFTPSGGTAKSIVKKVTIKLNKR